MKNHETSEDGFTRVDLIFTVAVIGTLAILAAVKSFAAQNVSCVGNKAQLVRALHLYAADNGDFLPLMNDGITSAIWLSHSDMALPDATNTAKLVNPSFSQLAPYLNGQASVFKCPANTAQYNVGGRLVTRVRDVSMSQAVGTNPQSPGAKRATDGPWLDGAHSHVANQVFRTYARLADIVNPRPSDLWIFLDEGPESINDTAFGCMGPRPTASGYNFIDFPATFHNSGTGFGFADGHGEIHTWASTIGTPNKPATGPGVQIDLDWLARHTTARIADQP